jgi:hypothetical protein
MMQELDVVLFFELGEELIGAVTPWRGSEQHGYTVVAGVGFGGRGIEGKQQAITRSSTAGSWRGQGGLLWRC